MEVKNKTRPRRRIDPFNGRAFIYRKNVSTAQNLLRPAKEKQIVVTMAFATYLNVVCCEIRRVYRNT